MESPLKVMPRRPILETAEDRRAFDEEFVAGQAFSRSGGIATGTAEVLAFDLQSLEGLLERGRTDYAATIAAQTLGLETSDLQSILAMQNKSRAGLLGYLTGLIAGAKVKVVNHSVEEPSQRRRLYGR